MQMVKMSQAAEPPNPHVMAGAMTRGERGEMTRGDEVRTMNVLTNAGFLGIGQS